MLLHTNSSPLNLLPFKILILCLFSFAFSCSSNPSKHDSSSPFEKTKQAHSSAGSSLLKSVAPAPLTKIPIADCLVERTAIDIGSATTKMQIATVNICAEKETSGAYATVAETGEITHTQLTQDFKVEYKDNIQKSTKNNGQKNFSTEVLEKATAVFKEIVEISKKHGISSSHIRGIATAAFREANNAQSFLEKIEKELGIKIEIISQAEEAELGYKSTRSQLPAPKASAPLLVWDIGGGSMQMTYQDLKNKNFEIFEGQLASVSFKNHFIEKVQKKDLTLVQTPNPIDDNEAKIGLDFVKSHATREVNSKIKTHMKNLNVYGMGGVLAVSLPAQISPHQAMSEVSLDSILFTLKKQLNKTDEQIRSKYASTDVTNLILVAAYMQAMGLTRYTVATPNSTYGLLIENTHWY